MKQLYILLIAAGFIQACNSEKEQAVHPVTKDITETVFASGSLDLDSRYNLVVQSDGYLLSTSFTEGDRVSAGQLLAVIDNKPNSATSAASAQQLAIAGYNTGADAPALKQVEANIAFAKDKLAQDELQASRLRKLLASNSVAKVEVENAELQVRNSTANVKALTEQYALLKQQAKLNYIAQESQQKINATNNNFNQVKAPVEGKILKRLKQAGDYVRRGEVLAVIGNPGTLIARINVDENSIAKVKQGQKVWIQLNTNKGKMYQGTINDILPMFDEPSQSYICKVRFDSLPEFPVVGTQLEANIIIGTKKSALLIPRNYLNFDNKVMVKGKDKAVKVTTGIVSTEWVEILSGLTTADELQPLQP